MHNTSLHISMVETSLIVFLQYFERLLFVNEITFYYQIHTPSFVYRCSRDDYNGLISDIFQTILFNVRPLIHCLSNAMYGCPIKLGTNVVINGF